MPLDKVPALGKMKKRIQPPQPKARYPFPSKGRPGERVIKSGISNVE